MFDVEAVEEQSWIAHVPRALLDEPLVELLALDSSPSRPLRAIVLGDGSRLLCGTSSVGTWRGAEASNDSLHAAGEDGLRESQPQQRSSAPAGR